MSIIPKLATSLGRRDELPNQELAASIVRQTDAAAISELVDNLTGKNKGIRHDCIKVLYEIGYADPRMIAEYLNAFLGLLDSKDNRLQWGGMTAVGCIAKIDPKGVFKHLPTIIAAADKGSVITRDHCVNILIELLASPTYANEACAQLERQLTSCPTNQLAMYAERAAPAIPAHRRDAFLELLTSRLDDLPKDSLRKRVEKVIRKM
jgi:hypothetical protein